MRRSVPSHSWSSSTRPTWLTTGMIDEQVLDSLTKRGWHVVKTSAKTGAEVEDTFTELSRIDAREVTRNMGNRSND